ncbi:MAG: mechanosensitive ion channel family protein [Candidatus Nanopusillus sp.]
MDLNLTNILIFIIILTILFYLTLKISNYFYNKYKHIDKYFSIALRNIIRVIGYFIIIIFVLSYFNVGLEYVLASSTIIGIIAGLALQPVLSNLFAGILLLLSGSFKPGDEVRILTYDIPYTILNSPGYKYFSREFLHLGYKRIIYEISLFFTKIILDTGEILLIPNNVLLSGGIINYSETLRESNEKFMSMRFELPQKIDPDKAINDIKNILSKYNNFEVYLDEQSDKDYYILLMEGKVNIDNYKKVKSEILKELIKYKNSINENKIST